MKLAFIGSANWDLYVNDKGRIKAIPKPDKQDCGSCEFGDKWHIKRLMQQGYFNDTPTDAGLELMEGLHTILFGNGARLLSF